MSDYNPYESTTLFRHEKCQECGANMNADCHAHSRHCSLSCKEHEYDNDCNNPPNTPIGGGLVILILFAIIYFGIKQFRTRKRNPMSFDKYSSKVIDYLPLKFHKDNVEILISMRTFLFIQGNMDKPAKETAKLLIEFMNNNKY